MTYCRRCGHLLINQKCHHCGADYKQDTLNEMKQNMKKKIKQKYNIPGLRNIIVVTLMVALVVVFCYFLFTNSGSTGQASSNSNSTGKSPDAIQAAAVEKKIDEEMGIPKLRVFHQMVNKIDFARGCFGKVTGGVTNTGPVTAKNVVLFCSTQDGASVERDLGDIAVLETVTFEAYLNYECSKLYKEDCTAICDNC